MPREWKLRPRSISSRAMKDGCALIMGPRATLGFASRVPVWRPTGVERKSTRRDKRRREKGWKIRRKRRRKRKGRSLGPWVAKSLPATHHRISRAIGELAAAVVVAVAAAAAARVKMITQKIRVRVSLERTNS